MKHALYIPRLYSDRAYEGARLQVTRACTTSRSDIARLAASHAGLYARLTLVIVTTPPHSGRFAKRNVGSALVHRRASAATS